MFDVSRNQFFLVGLVLLAVGAQFRVVYAVTLTPEFTQFLAEQTDHPMAAMNAASAASTPDHRPAFRKTFEPPDWAGWALISAGAVLVLHALAMPKPG